MTDTKPLAWISADLSNSITARQVENIPEFGGDPSQLYPIPLYPKEAVMTDNASIRPDMVRDNPYSRIMRAAKRGLGIRLSADEVWEMSHDDAIATRSYCLEHGPTGKTGFARTTLQEHAEDGSCQNS